MNTKMKLFGALLALVFVTGLLASCGDPRKNCNHPQHGMYMKQKMMKNRGF